MAIIQSRKRDGHTPEFQAAGRRCLRKVMSDEIRRVCELASGLTREASKDQSFAIYCTPARLQSSRQVLSQPPVSETKKYTTESIHLNRIG